ncbi:Hypothetical protein R9X50_00225300 [Acrodontium crateriforme]|uniref:Phosphatidylinositol transfer protein SFH5 n=1 Tax=Acrodontium crateriforme TaxID=150365 RepID=A0AAQ3M0T4_9PEZI|nr:Hypothetical protein R9X50_00225300 [Acrodontium crateriforme]
MAAPASYDVASVTAPDATGKGKEEISYKSWTEVVDDHPLSNLAAQLPDILGEAGHNEMYGVELHTPKDGQQSPHTTLIILQKFLRANAGDATKARTQLLDALKWRKEYNPLSVRDEIFPKEKFGGLGYITSIKRAKQPVAKVDVAVFNVYGAAAKDPAKAFGDTDEFVKWRVALMERTLEALQLNKADQPIPDYQQGTDQYQALQIHDYESVSFFRQPAEIKAASSKIIEMFQKYYPETVSFKYFVNVPLVMQWMMGAMKALMSSDSIQKMTWMSNGKDLHTYLGSDIPKEYGGTCPSLEGSARTVKFDDGSEGANSGIAVVAPTATDEAPEKDVTPIATEPELVKESKTEATTTAKDSITMPIATNAPAPEIKKSGPTSKAAEIA